MNTQTTAIDTTPDIEDVLSDDDLQKFKARSISGAFVFTLRTLFLTGLGIVASGILAGKLSEEKFGIYGFVTQIIVLLQFFTDVGLGPTLIQKKTEPSLKEYQTVFTFQQLLAWGVFLLAAAVGMLPPVYSRIGFDGFLLLLALAFSLPLGSLKIIPSIRLERELKFSNLTIPNIAEQVVYNVLLIVLVLNGFELQAYAYAILARGIVGVVVMNLLEPWRFGFHFDMKILKETVAVGVKFQASDFLARIKDNLSSIIIALFLSQKEFGYITFAKNFSQMPYNLTVQNVISITFPAFSRFQNDVRLLKRAIEKTLFFIALTTFPVLVGMSLFVFPFTEIFANYQKWQPALPLFVMMTLSIGWGAISTPLTNTLNAIGQINKTLRLMLMWTGLTWLLMPALTWWLGFNGVGVATVIIAFTSVFPIVYVKQHVDIDVWAQVWPALLGTVSMVAVGIIGWNWWPRSLTHLLIGMALTGISYLVTVSITSGSKIIAELRSIKKSSKHAGAA